MKYQPEIDGLRTISVVSVLLYHLGVSWIPGGFTGVDIFFVISGFLITTIIKNEIQREAFSFPSFYARRIRRIFPALTAVLLVTSVAGYFFLAPGDFDGQARSAIAAAASVSNIYFYLNTGYFDNSAETLPLLHTWSLGVEEQFYIFLPILLILAFKVLPRKFVGPALIAVIALSFFASVWRVGVEQKAAFYLMHYRAWELGVGAVLAFAPSWRSNAPQWLAHLSTVAGIGLIGYSLFSSHPPESFPGLGALPATLGAALLLAFCGRGGIVNRALSLPPLVFMGKISYSLYLWHWPLIVYWRHYTSWEPMSLMEQVLLGIAATIAGWASWRFIETPFRYGAATNWRTIWAGIAAMAFVSIPALLIASSSGMPARLPPSYHALQSKDTMWNWDCPENRFFGKEYFCSAGAPWSSAKVKAVVIGDSHAQHLMPLLHEVGIQTKTAIGLLGPCPPVFDPAPGGLRHFDRAFLEQCFESRPRLFRFLASNPDVSTVIVAGLWPMLGYSVFKTDDELSVVREARNTPSPTAPRDAFLAGANHISQELTALANELLALGSGVRMIVFSDIPTFKRDPLPCVLTRSSALLRRACDENVEMVSTDSMEMFQFPMAEILRNTAKESKAFEVVIPTDSLCTTSLCEAYINNSYIYRDSDHLRRNMDRETNAILAEKLGLTTALKNNASRQREFTALSK
ncbi:acyltransferase family protein [Alcaligenes aquatilis]|uniref:acyltransferase family protein n=1 Tax=Alcaligenes aquatilis TaxID=323284 RepID=UPI003F8FCFE9